MGTIEWINDWLNEWKNDWMNEWLNEWINEQLYDNNHDYVNVLTIAECLIAGQYLIEKKLFYDKMQNKQKMFVFRTYFA